MTSDRLSTTFSALADPTRRAILARLISGEASVTQLAEPFRMSMPAVSKHLKVLERAGLIARSREAQWRPCQLNAGPLKDVADWAEHYRRFFEQSFDRLEIYLQEMKLQQKHMRTKNKEQSLTHRKKLRKNKSIYRRTHMAESKEGTAATQSSEREFVISRIFNAPRELLFKAWTDPKHVAEWWGPRGMTIPVCEMDVRPGGAYRIVMRMADGVEFPSRGVFREIVKPERIVMTMDCSEHPKEWHDMVNPNRQKGDTNPAGEMICTATFEDLGGKTRLTIRMLLKSPEVRDSLVKMGMSEGWSQSLDRLGELLSKM